MNYPCLRLTNSHQPPLHLTLTSLSLARQASRGRLPVPRFSMVYKRN